MSIRQYLLAAFAVTLAACTAPTGDDSEQYDEESEEEVGTAEDAIWWEDDIKVTVDSWAADHSSVTFRVEDVGDLDYTNLGYASTASSVSGTIGKVQYGSGVISYIWVGSYKLITVGCPIAGGYTCTAVKLEVPLAGDSTPANNTAIKVF